jgi:hypothetical protein
VLDLTLLRAAEGAGMEKLAAGLGIERLALRPRTRRPALALAA